MTLKQNKMINEDFVSFEIARLLKEKGFDIYVSSFYDVDGEFSRKEADWNWNIGSRYSAPTLQMAMKWLREMHGLYVVVRPYVTEEGILSLFDIKSIKEKDIVVNIRTKTGFDSYEEACEAAIKYCLENWI